MKMISAKREKTWHVTNWEIAANPTQFFAPNCLTAIFHEQDSGKREEWTLGMARDVVWGNKIIASDVPRDVLEASLKLPIVSY